MFFPIPRTILIPYRLIRLIYEMLRKKGRSNEDKEVLKWLAKPDDPLRPKDHRKRYFTELNSAIETNKSIFMKYLGRNKLTSRKVQPKRLFRRGEHIYLEALCLRKKEYRRFRLDRIKYLRKN